MARFVVGQPLRSGRLGLLPAAFNPPTVAHLALADAAAEQADLDQVVFVLPENLPHKPLHNAEFDDRLAMLVAAVDNQPSRAVACAAAGLFYEIAEEFRRLCGDDVEIALICGRDAAERIVGWDYGQGPSIAEQLERFELLVAERNGPYVPPPELAARIRSIRLDRALQAISSSEVRRRIAAGLEWESLVPPAVARIIRRSRLYGASESAS